jgi:hypothetical protein
MTGNADKRIQRLEAFLNQWEKRFAEWETEASKKPSPAESTLRTPGEILDNWLQFKQTRSAAASNKDMGSPSGKNGRLSNNSFDLLDSFLSKDG